MMSLAHILLQIFLIFSAALAMHVSCTAPTPAVPKERRKMNDISAVGPAMNLYRYTCWIHGIIEILIICLPVITQQFSQFLSIQWINDTFFALFLPPSLGQDANIFFPPLRILGAFLVISGSRIRYLSYRELGRHFTFHVAVLDSHNLVTTGPYSIVRHPGYASGFFICIGSILWHATAGSWLVQSRFYKYPLVWILLLSPGIVVTIGSVIVGVVVRPRKEDELLKKEFGKQWSEWEKRVPYRLFPGIY